MQPPDVNLAEQKLIEKKGFRNFIDFVDEAGIRWVKRKDNGNCFFLTVENKCSIYDVRPSICKLEPFTITDYDPEQNKIELALNFPFSCCCEGVCDDGAVSIESIGKAARAVMEKILELTAKEMALPVDDRKVRFAARAKLLRRTVEMADLHV
jgi:Fe-S-cluster containining protein